MKQLDQMVLKLKEQFNNKKKQLRDQDKTATSSRTMYRN